MPEAHEPISNPSELSDDEKHLARLGYTPGAEPDLVQLLQLRHLVLDHLDPRRLLHDLRAGLEQRRPGGDLVGLADHLGLFILLIGFTISELVSAYPTSGGIYWWASKLGGPAAGFFTGWLNLIGLLAVTASVAYGAATFLDLTLSTYQRRVRRGLLADPRLPVLRGRSWCSPPWPTSSAGTCWRSSTTSRCGGTSPAPRSSSWCCSWSRTQHQSASFVFTERINNSGFSSGAHWFLVLPFGFLLTQYTITGFDASAHLSEETQGAADGAAKGIWRSIFYSAVGGYLLLLAFLFAVPGRRRGHRGRRRRRPDLRAGAAHRLALPGAADLHGRAALLHDGVPDQRLADDLRVQPRRRDPRVVVALQGARQDPDPRQRGHLRRRGRDPDHAPRAHPGRHQRCPGAGRVLRRRVGGGHRPLPRVPDPDLPALAARCGVRCPARGRSARSTSG